MHNVLFEDFVCVCTCICVHSLHGQNKEFCSVLVAGATHHGYRDIIYTFILEYIHEQLKKIHIQPQTKKKTI